MTARSEGLADIQRATPGHTAPPVSMMPDQDEFVQPWAPLGCPGGGKGLPGGPGAELPELDGGEPSQRFGAYLEQQGESANGFDRGERGGTPRRLPGNRHQLTEEQWLAKQKCYKGFVQGHAGGRRGPAYYIRMIVLCEKEWCKDCGASMSRWHRRKIARWLPRVVAMGQKGPIGYLVVTVPKFLREKFKDPEALKAMRRYLVEKMKREGFHRGLIKLHRGGEKNPGIYNPHWNFLFEVKEYPKGTVDPKRGSRILPAGQMLLGDLEDFREDVRKWLEDFTGETVPVVSVKYSYKTTWGQKFGILKYVTKSTLTWPDPELIELHNGLNTGSPWGSASQWTDAKEWADTEGCLKLKDIMDRLSREESDADPSPKESGHEKDWESLAVEAITRRILPVMVDGRKVHRKIYWEKFESARGLEAGVHAAIGPELAGTGIFVDERTYRAMEAFYNSG